jgi:soluble lytic murein transglycosylase-like protein
MKRLIAVIVVFLFLAGCTTDQLAQYQQIRDEVEVRRVATTQAAADVEAEIAKLPPNDPVRKALEKSVATMNKYVAQADTYLRTADAVVAAAGSGDTSAVVEAVRSVPVVGQYAGLLALLGTFVYQQIKLTQKRREGEVLVKANEQVVKSVEAAFPIKTEEQKLKLASMQDTQTQAIVTEIKGQ